MNLGRPDGTIGTISCGNNVILDLGAPTAINRLIYYEHHEPSRCHSGICLNWVIISLSLDANGPWFTYFYWGDSNDDNNGDIDPSHYQFGEFDEEIIQSGELYTGFGLPIDISDTYRYIRISAPMPCNNPAEVDSVEIE